MRKAAAPFDSDEAAAYRPRLISAELSSGEPSPRWEKMALPVASES